MDSLSAILGNVLVVEPTAAPDEVIHQTAEAGADSETERVGEIIEEDRDAKKIKNEAKEAISSPVGSFWYLEGDTRRNSHQFSDRIMEKLLSVMIVNDSEARSKIPAVRTRMQKQRPPFSVNTMNTNSTQLAQKGSPFFEYIDAVILCFTWDNPYYTCGILLLITHAILRPELFFSFPPALILLKYMFPSYLKLYPSDDTFVDGKYFLRNPIPHLGKPLAKYEAPKVAAMYSHEYLMNFTDMQNHIVPYIRFHDFLLEWGKQYLLFEDEQVSTLAFLALTFTVGFFICFFPTLATVALKVVSIQAIAIVMVWTFFICCHPVVRNKLLDNFDTEEARLSRLEQTDQAEKYFMKFLDNEPEDEVQCEVEIFELQEYVSKTNSWKAMGFSRDFYSLNHPDRILESAEVDTSFDTSFDEVKPSLNISLTGELSGVKPPVGWRYTDKEWRIDFDPHSWVQDNCIMDLVSVDNEEKWVYDGIFESSEHEKRVFRRRRWQRYTQRERLGSKSHDGGSLEQRDSRK